MPVYKKTNTADPTVSFITLADMKLYLKIDNAVEDSLITNLIKSAYFFAQECTKSSILDETFQATFYNGEQTILSRGVFHSVVSVSIDGSSLPVEDYSIVGGYYGEVCLSSPTTEEVLIEFKAGYGENNVPFDLRNAIMQQVAYTYENRGDLDSAGSSRNGISSNAMQVFNNYLNVVL